MKDQAIVDKWARVIRDRQDVVLPTLRALAEENGEQEDFEEAVQVVFGEPLQDNAPLAAPAPPAPVTPAPQE